MLPILDASVPRIRITGPIAAAMPAILMICIFSASSKLLNLSKSPVAFSTSPDSSPLTRSEIMIFVVPNLEVNCVHDPARLSICFPAMPAAAPKISNSSEL